MRTCTLTSLSAALALGVAGCGGGDTTSADTEPNGGVGGSTGSGGSSATGGSSASGGSSSGGSNSGGSNSGGSSSGGSSSGTGGSSGSGVWRPFSDASPWNTPIGDDPTLDPASSELIAHLEQSVADAWLGVAVNEWSVPVYWVDSTTTPWVDVQTDLAALGFDEDPRAPIPAGAAPDPQADAHMVIVDRAVGTSWDFFGAANNGGTWTCMLCATADLDGTGVRPAHDSGEPWQWSHGARACGFPLMAGLITTEEMQAGNIEHALVMGYPGIRSQYYKPPASTAQSTFGSINGTSGIPCGGRVQLDPALDVESLGLSDSGVVLARALQRYGAYIGDFAGSIVVYADVSPDAHEVWQSGVLGLGEISTLDLSSFRVLELGTLRDNMN